MTTDFDVDAEPWNRNFANVSRASLGRTNGEGKP